MSQLIWSEGSALLRALGTKDYWQVILSGLPQYLLGIGLVMVMCSRAKMEWKRGAMVCFFGAGLSYCVEQDINSGLVNKKVAMYDERMAPFILEQVQRKQEWIGAFSLMMILALVVWVISHVRPLQWLQRLLWFVGIVLFGVILWLNYREMCLFHPNLVQ
jgi:hypothetical protein